jgi:tetratricopeptide (TPR) repeat protein
VAAKTRATYLMTAAYFRTGPDLEIKYGLSDTRDKRSIGSGNVRGKENDCGQLAAQLSRKVLVDLGFTTEPPFPKMPVSLAALRFYQLARQSDRKYRKEDNGQYFQQALDYYDQAVREEPRYALAFVGLGDLYQRSYVVSHKREDIEKALDCYERAYGVEPESPETNAGLGWAYFLRGDNDGAFSFFKRAFQFAPGNPSIAANVGSFFLSIGLPGQAARFYTVAIDRGGFYSTAASESSFQEVHRLRATCYERLGEKEKAVADARTWLELEPDSLDAELFLARMLISQKSLGEAERQIGVVEKVDPANPNLGPTRALLYAARGEKDKALPLIEGAKKEPFYFNYLLSRVYAGCGLKDDAIRIIRLGIDRGFENIQSYLGEYPMLAGSWLFDSLRGDPRFEEILSQQKKRYEEDLRKYGGL